MYLYGKLNGLFRIFYKYTLLSMYEPTKSKTINLLSTAQCMLI